MKFSEHELSQKVKELGYEVGFDLVGISAMDSPDPKGSFSNWLRSGYSGEMEYLRKTASQRANPAEWLPWAKSVVSVGLTYACNENENGEKAPRSLEVSRYARGKDYHGVMQAKLQLLLDRLQREVEEPVRGKIAVDSSPVLERAFAARAGLGWFGKNTLLISPRLGSYLFLGELFVDLRIAPDLPMRERCGQCRACLDSCPTQAFVGPYILDARRCISYLTIELKGAIPRSLRRLMGNHVFGCDVCQEVCPYNVRHPATREASFVPLANLSLDELLLQLKLSGPEFKQRFHESPLLRAKRRGLLRNVAVVMGNSRNSAFVPVLKTMLENETEPLVRGHAAWALGEIGNGDAEEILRHCQATEQDSFVSEEIRWALENIASGASADPPGQSPSLEKGRPKNSAS